MEAISLLVSIVGVFLGGLITYVVAKSHYEKASLELRTEAAELQRLSTLILKALDISGLVKIQKGLGGEIVGFEITVTPMTGIASEEVVSKPEVRQEGSENSGL